MNKTLARAVKLSERFHGLKPRWLKRVELKQPREVVQLGVVAQLDYLSDKYDGKLRRYYHEFDKPPVLLADVRTQADGSRVLLIVGHLKIDEKGIIG